MVRYSIEIGQQEQDILKEIVLASDKNVKKRHDGIHFIYHEYEIASYAEGEQDLVIPWAWLQRENLLTSDFVKQKYYDLGYTAPVKG